MAHAWQPDHCLNGSRKSVKPNSSRYKTSTKFQGKYCPRLLTASFLSGVTQLISAVQTLTSVTSLPPFRSVTQSTPQARLHCLTPQTADGTRPLRVWDRSLPQQCCRSPRALSTLGYNALHSPPWDAAQFFKLLEDLPAGSGPVPRTQAGDWSVLRSAAIPSASADTGVGAGGAGGVLGPDPRALQQHSSLFPHQQWELPRASPAVFCPFALQQIIIIKNYLFGLLKQLQMLHERWRLVAESVTTSSGSFFGPLENEFDDLGADCCSLKRQQITLCINLHSNPNTRRALAFFLLSQLPSLTFREEEGEGQGRQRVFLQGF